MTKLELICRLSEAADRSLKMFKGSKTISKNRLMKLKKAELEQFLKAYETINNLVSKCLVDDHTPNPCDKCGVQDKVACCGCMEYFEWRDQS